MKDEDYSIRKCMEEVIEIAGHELNKKNIELTVNNCDDLPTLARGDSNKFK